MKTLNIEEIEKQYDRLGEFKHFWCSYGKMEKYELGYNAYGLILDVSKLARHAANRNKEGVGRAVCGIFVKLYYFCKEMDVSIFDHFTSNMDAWMDLAAKHEVEVMLKEEIERKEKEKDDERTHI